MWEFMLFRFYINVPYIIVGTCLTSVLIGQNHIGWLVVRVLGIYAAFVHCFFELPKLARNPKATMTSWRWLKSR